MIASETFRQALANLWSHKLRSLLTILGVVIGVSSVLAVTTIGTSFEEAVVSQFDSVDDKSIFVTATLTPANSGPPDCMQFCNIFTDHDRERLEAIDGVDRVVVSAKVVAQSLEWQGNQLTFEELTATFPDADEIRESSEYLTGGTFTPGQRQVVLGHGVAKLLAGGKLGASPNGAPTVIGGGALPKAGDELQVRLGDGSTVTTTVAGVLDNDTTLFGDRNNRVFVPIDPFYTTKRVSPATGQEGPVYNGFTVIADDPRVVERVRDDVRAYMDGPADAKQLAIEGEEILVATAADIQENISQLFDQISIFINAIAGVSLVVGAIGIANIMLVSVTERTREIGVMKAIGAKDGEILRLFLLEAILIGMVGSLIGIAIGLGLGAVVVTQLFETELFIPATTLVNAILIGIVVGVVAGFLPARRATKIQPIKALAYE